MAVSACGSYRFQSSKEVLFGQGGGVTGKVNTWVLSGDGRLQTISEGGKRVLLKKIAPKTTNLLLSQAAALKKPQIQCYRPGNLYYFISVFEPYGTNPDCMWGENGYTPAAEVTALYSKLMKLVE